MISKWTVGIAAITVICLGRPALGQVFTPPLVPPEMHYTIDAEVDLKSAQLTGQGSVKVCNIGVHDIPALKTRQTSANLRGSFFL